MKRIIHLFVACILLAGILWISPHSVCQVLAGTRNQGSWGDNGDGTYNNPILPGDYSDPDVIRVGEDYFAITSTFQFVPGITVLHSTDLVNWEILGGAVQDLTRISDKYNYDRMQGYGKIIWAPCITYQESTETFYIHFCTPDEGLFVTTASREGIWESAWTDLERVTYADDRNAPGAGWDDCGVLWDDDGQGYLVANHFAGGYQNYLFRLSEDGKTLEDHGVRIHYQNDGLLEGRGEGGTEAFKLFKKDGYYYFLHNGVVDSGRELFFLRAKHIYGDHADGTAGTLERPGAYEHSQHGTVEWGYHEWCQGNIVDTPDSYPGEKKWYFFTHQGSGSAGIGRPVCLVPVAWGEDGFPAADDHKEQWERIEKPMAGSTPVRPQTSDDFSGGEISPQWMWSFQPKPGMWSLKERPGYLRMYAFQPIAADRLDQAGNCLLQRSYATEANIVKATLDISGMEEGQNVGLMHASSDVYGAVGIWMEGNQKYLCSYASWGKVDKLARIPEGIQAVYLKSQWDIRMESTFSFSFDGKTYLPAGNYGLQWNKYRGDSVGFFCYNNEGEHGYVDIDSFTYEMDVQEEAPLILGVDDGGEYEGRVKVTIPRGNITVNGKAVDKVAISRPGSYTVRAEDNGKWREVTFQVKNLPTASLRLDFGFDKTVGNAEFVSLTDGKLGSLEHPPTPMYGSGIEDFALRMDGTYGLKLGSLAAKSFSVAMWLKLSPENLGSCNSVLFGNRDNGSKSQENWISARFDAGYPFVWSNYGGRRYDLARDPKSYAPGQWFHYVVSNYEGEVTTYIDGTEAGCAIDSSPIAEGVDFYIGGTFWNDAFYGWLDDIKIYEGALSQEEVEQLFLEKAVAADKVAKTDSSNIAVSLETALLDTSTKNVWFFADVCLEDKKLAAATVQVPDVAITLAGDTQIGTLDNRSQGTIVLKSSFCGNAALKVLDYQHGRAVAKVEQGADWKGISVVGLPSDCVLKLEGNLLKIAGKESPKPDPDPKPVPTPDPKPVQKPGKVSGLKASSSTDRIKLTWKKASNADGYRIYRWSETARNYKFVKKVKSLQYTDKKRTPSSAYRYKVCAYRMDGKKELAGNSSKVVKVLTKPGRVKITSLKRNGKNGILKFQKAGKANIYRIYHYDAKKKKYVAAYQVKGKKLYVYKGKKYVAAGNVKTRGKTYTATLKKAAKGKYVIKAIREEKGYPAAVGAASKRKSLK
ncbi:family 43 glycosylhydrolase [Lachnospiraceae bacterium 29-84]